MNKCICGCTQDQHEFEHEHSNYPESRSVEYWRACEAHNCGRFRPSLPWPAERGCYWWKHGNDCEIVYATDFGDEQLSILRVGFEYRLSPESAVRFGPARFTKLLERNPYESTPG